MEPKIKTDSITVKRKPLSGPAIYKKMKKTIEVKKEDGSIGEWGRDPNIRDTIIIHKDDPQKMSDKANGHDNTYNPARNQPSGPAVKTIKPSFRY